MVKPLWHGWATFIQFNFCVSCEYCEQYFHLYFIFISIMVPEPVVVMVPPSYNEFDKIVHRYMNKTGTHSQDNLTIEICMWQIRCKVLQSKTQTQALLNIYLKPHLKLFNYYFKPAYVVKKFSKSTQGYYSN